MKMTRSNKNSTVLGAVRAVVIGAVCGAVLCAGLLALFAFGFVKAICDQPHHYCGFRFQRFCSGILCGEGFQKEWSAVWGNLWASIIYPVFACGCDRLSWGTRADDPHALSSDGFSGCDWRVAFCE